MAAIGDLDGDGIDDLAVGAARDDDGGADRGSVHILFLNADGTVKAEQKISETQGGLTATLNDNGYFGWSVAALGDVDGDGVGDLAVGARTDDGGGSSEGAVFVLFLNTDGTVKAEQKISSADGGLTATLDTGDNFGSAVAGLGDLDGDGVNDLVVGAEGDDDGGSGRGAVHVLLLNANGTVKAEQKISDTVGGLTAVLDDSDKFGWSVGAIGDLDGDGTEDLAVGARYDDDGGINRGAVHILFLNTDGSVRAEQKVSSTTGGLGATIADYDFLGSGVAGVGDMDGDGVEDLVVGAYGDDDGGTYAGAVHVWSMNTDGTVKAELKISGTAGGFTDPLTGSPYFGNAVAGLGDLDGDGALNLAIGSFGNDDGGTNHGAVYVLDLQSLIDSDGDGLWDQQEDANTDADDDPATNPGPDTDGDTIPNYLDADDDDDGTPTASENADPNGDGDPRDALDTDHDGQPDYLDDPATTPIDGQVGDEQKISATSGGLTGPLDGFDLFGHGVASIGDLDGDGINDLAIGAYQDDDGGSSRGAVYILFLNADGTVRAEQKISDTAGGLTATLDDTDQFGRNIAAVGDLDGDGLTDIAVGAFRDDDGGSNRGAVHILFLNADGTVRAEQKISDTAGGLVASLSDGVEFGRDVAGVGDVDGDGINDLAVGSTQDNDGGTDRGAVYILLLNADGTVKDEQKISSTQGGLTGPLDDDDEFGSGVAGIGDLDSDGVPDLVAAAHQDDDGATGTGALYVLLLNADGTVKSEQKISATSGGLLADLSSGDTFGAGVTATGDLDGDGVVDLLVGAPGDDGGASSTGAAHVVFLNADGTVKAEREISATAGGLTGPLEGFDSFGYAVAALGDLDGDGTISIAVGAHGDDDGAGSAGAVYVLELAALTTVTVNSTGDGGDATPGDEVCDTGGTNADGLRECTLRAAIEEANASVGIDTVHFAIPASDGGYTAGPPSFWTIEPASAALPAVTAGVTIDATTQSGWVDQPIVELDGTTRAGFSTEDGLDVQAASSVVRGLAVIDWPDDGVVVSADGVTVAGSWFSIAADGTRSPIGSADVLVSSGANAVVGGAGANDGNRFGGTGSHGGVRLDGTASGTRVEGNVFGVLPDGVTSTTPGTSLLTTSGSSTGVVVHDNRFTYSPPGISTVGLFSGGTSEFTANILGIDELGGDVTLGDNGFWVAGTGLVMIGGTDPGRWQHDPQRHPWRHRHPLHRVTVDDPGQLDQCQHRPRHPARLP